MTPVLQRGQEAPGALEWEAAAASEEDLAAASRAEVAAGSGRGPGHGACRSKAEDKEWIHVTKLGRLVKDIKIKSLEEIYLFSLSIKESEIIDFFLGHPSRTRF